MSDAATTTDLRALLEAVREAPALVRADQHGGGCEYGAPCGLCARIALCDALLRAPAALEAVEALVMLGRARAQREGAVSVTDALDAIGQAESTVNKLADRLAADAKGGA